MVEELHTYRLVNICKIIKYIIIVSMVLLIISTVIEYWYPENIFRNINEDVVLLGNTYRVILTVAGCFFDVFPILFLISLYRLFDSYQRNIFFSNEVVSLFRRISFWLIFTGCAMLFSESFDLFVINAATGISLITISFDSDLLIVISSALVSYAFSLVMKEGLIINSENELTV